MPAHRKSRITGLLIFFLVTFAFTALAGPPRELGAVDWMRDLSSARERSESENVPLFLLFQEIPGCQTCVSFGEDVLSHPLLVEAIEDEFVPVAIYNNRGGADAEALRRFGEPAWNNPVVRFVSASGDDLIPRVSGVWRPGAIARRMTNALEAAQKPIPSYLASLRDELDFKASARATFSMHCYWEGEACLGALPGLLSSRVGSLEGREVVEVRFDPSRISYAQLLERVARLGCADGVFARGTEQGDAARRIFGERAVESDARFREASARNQKYHLKRNRKLARLDLTPAQSSRANHAVWSGASTTRLLSPRQQRAIR